MKIVTIEQIMSEYNFSRKYATKILNTKGCPILPRKKGQNYRIVKDAFDAWIQGQRK